MPRIRSVHPGICDDDVLAEVTAYAERTWVRLWTHLDDEGRGPDNAKLWKGKLYPLHDDVTPDRVERDLTELEACGLILRYEADGKRWLCAKPATWKKYQRPQHPTPSKIPPPPEPSRTPHEDYASPPVGVVVVVGEERRRVGGEGESEGEVPGRSRPVDNPRALGLAARCASVPDRISPKLAVIQGQGNPAAGADVTPLQPPAAHGDPA